MNVKRPSERPALVLSNALGTTAALWDPQLPALGGFDVVRYEHPPYSSVAELGREVLRIVPGRFSLCGLSLGGMVGMWIAVNAPDRVDRLVLACTSARFGEPEGWDTKAALVRSEGMAAVAGDALDAWFTPRFVDRRRFLELQLAVPAEDYARGLEAIGAFDFRDELAQIAAPTLVIAGAEDPATTVGDAEFLAERIPGARLTVIPGAAHLANVEQPERFNAELVHHLAGAE
ncbi:MAG TPA: alpha/beta fold hydrolase [Gaiellaceae bacterium]|nr:alpha/beta fold hydrolase [Gaiellaceae bacterium]